MLFIEHYATTFDYCDFISQTPQLPGWTFLDANTRELTIRNSQVNNTVATAARFNCPSPNLRVEMNTFSGRGLLEFAVGRGSDLLKKAVIASNTFGTNFTAIFGDITHGVVQIRNNKGMQYQTVRGDAVQCDAGIGTGVAAGCDPRAECSDLKDLEGRKGGVQCNCESSRWQTLSFKRGGVPDGSRCEFIGQELGIFQKKTMITATVRKPVDLNINISVEAISQEAFHATITADSAFLRVNGKQSITDQYLMSPSQFLMSKPFTLTVLANETRWADSSVPKQGVVVVNAPDRNELECVDLV